jgi:hypothetical protein
VQAGKLSDAGRLLEQGTPRFGDDPSFIAARAYYQEWSGAYAAALATLLQTEPSFRDGSPEVSVAQRYYLYPDAIFLFRRTGDVTRARHLADAFVRGMDAYWKPVVGAERGEPLWMRARAAAAIGDQAELIARLSQLYETGGLLPAWVVREPLFRPYAREPAVAALLVKFDTRRAEWRGKLASEGL